LIEGAYKTAKTTLPRITQLDGAAAHVIRVLSGIHHAANNLTFGLEIRNAQLHRRKNGDDKNDREKYVSDRFQFFKYTKRFKRNFCLRIFNAQTQ
jgi:hypothetical protein